MLVERESSKDEHEAVDGKLVERPERVFELKIHRLGLRHRFIEQQPLDVEYVRFG